MTARLRFDVTGSQGDLYTIEVGETEGAGLWLTCSCPAGRNGQYCKHRFALLDGDVSALASGNPGDVERLRARLPGSRIAKAFEAIAEREAAVKKARAAVSAAKQALARAMHGR